MGDRVYVSLKVLKEHFKEARKLINETTSDVYETEDKKHVLLNYEEINYGELDGLSNLRKAFIPYDSTWEAGLEFGRGTEYCRFNDDGESIIKEIFDEDLNPQIEDLLALINDPEALRQWILDHNARNAVLDWNTQMHNTKIARTRALIGA